MRTRLNPAQALIYAMITTAAVDRTIADEELSRIGSFVRELPAFKGHDGDWLMGEAQACGKLLARPPNGVDTVLELVAEALPTSMYETAYVLCAEVAAADLVVGPEESRFLEKLAMKLSLDRLVCAALDRAAKARHQRA
jgi:tellurite resistance protein